MFGATTMGLAPDMLICAKGLSSAYIPISALMVNERIFGAMTRQSDDLGIFGSKPRSTKPPPRCRRKS